MLDIIFFAIIAAFIISRLFKALGDTQHNRDESEEKETFFQGFAAANETDLRKEIIQQIDIASALEASLPEEQRHVFEQLREQDITFTADKFVQGSKAAFEMIIKAFSDHDKEILENLLAKDVYADFETEIDRRIASNQRYEVTVVGVKSCDIQHAEIEKGNANITVKITSEQISLVKGLSDGALLSGNPSKISVVTDVWTFSKGIKSKSKMWQLVSTDAGE
jgi:predicted lipid-binding transport protein (Tim44 family)